MNVRVIRTIRDIEAEVWDGLAGDDPVFSHAWFLALEESLPEMAAPRHLILEDAGRIVGLLPCFIQYRDPYFTLAERLFGPAAPQLARLGIRVMPALLAYSPLAHRSRLLLDPSVDRRSAVREWSRSMEEICRRERIPVSGWIFVSGWDRHLAADTKAAGYAESFLAPTAVWVNRFARFTEYVDGFKSFGRHHYKKTRNEINRSLRSAVTLGEEPLAALDDQTLTQMHAVPYATHYPRRPSLLTPAFFAALKRAFGERAVVHTARKQGDLISYSGVIKGKNRWHMFVNGDAPGDAARADKLYFRLNYYYPIEQAIGEQMPRLDYGLAAYELKLQRGCDLEPLHMLLRAHSPALCWLPAWLRVVDLWYRYKHRRFGAALQAAAPNTPAAKKPPFWQRLRALLIEHRTFVLLSMSTAERTAAPARSDIRIAPLSAEELIGIRPTASKSRWQLFMRFQQDGYECFGAWIGPTLVGYMWAATQRQPFHYSGFFGRIPLKSDEAFLAYVYVWPAYRGQRIAVLLQQHVAQLLNARGMTRLYAGIVSTNDASLKSHAAMGAVPVQSWTYRRVGWMHWTSGSPIAGHLPAAAQEAGTPSLPARLLATVREQGIGGLARKIFKEAAQRVYESGVIYDLRIPLHSDGVFALPRLHRHPVIRRLGPYELERLRPMSSASVYRFLEEFQRQGFQCYVAELDGRVVAYNWYADRPYYSPVTRLTYDLKPGEIFLVFSYVPRQWRGKGIDAALKVGVYRRLQQEGIIQAARTVVDRTNRTSLRLLLRFGGTPVQQYRYTRIFGWRRARIEATSPAELARYAGSVKTVVARIPASAVQRREAVHAAR